MQTLQLSGGSVHVGMQIVSQTVAVLAHMYRLYGCTVCGSLP